MKKLFIKTVSFILSLMLCCSAFAGCGGSSKNSITFLYSGSTEILSVFSKMVDEFNKGEFDIWQIKTYINLK